MSTTDFKQLSRELGGRGGISGSILLFVILLFLCVAIFWANIAELNNVTRGQGKIISSMQNQMVQSSEGGVLKKVYVEEGQTVTSGELMIEIDPIEAKASFEQATQRLASLQIQQARLSSEINGIDLIFDEQLILVAPSVVNIETALYNSRKDDLSAQMAVLQKQYDQREQQLIETKVHISTAEDTKSLIEEQIAIIKPLVDAGLSPETELLSLRRQAKEYEGESKSAKASIERIKSSLEEIIDKKSSIEQTYMTNSQSELATIVSEIAEINSRVPALQERLARTQVRSPVTGIVNRLNFRTIGGFITPGDVIAELVPTGDDLVIEGRIDPKDIAYIKPGQDVNISLTAYDSSRYGTIDGKVIKVSPDAVQDKNTGMSYYTVTTSIDGTLVESDGSQVEIFPGMVASIDVLAGKRTVLEYLWMPMAKVKERAFTE